MRLLKKCNIIQLNFQHINKSILLSLKTEFLQIGSSFRSYSYTTFIPNPTLIPEVKGIRINVFSTAQPNHGPDDC